MISRFKRSVEIDPNQFALGIQDGAAGISSRRIRAVEQGDWNLAQTGSGKVTEIPGEVGGGYFFWGDVGLIARRFLDQTPKRCEGLLVDCICW